MLLLQFPGRKCSLAMKIFGVAWLVIMGLGLSGCGESEETPVATWDPVTIDSANAEEIASSIWLSHTATQPEDMIPSPVWDTLNEYIPFLAYRPNDLAVDVACPMTGEVTLIGALGDVNQAGWTTGDTANATYIECKSADSFGTEETTSGKLSVTVTTADDESRTTTSTFDELKTTVGTWGTLTQEGEMVIQQSQDEKTTTVSSDRLTVDHEGSLQILEDYSSTLESEGTEIDSPFVLEFQGTQAGTALDGSVMFETLTPFEGLGTNYPSEGELLITGANASTVKLTAQADATNVEFVD